MGKAVPDGVLVTALRAVGDVSRLTGQGFFKSHRLAARNLPRTPILGLPREAWGCHGGCNGPGKHQTCSSGLASVPHRNARQRARCCKLIFSAWACDAKPEELKYCSNHGYR